MRRSGIWSTVCWLSVVSSAGAQAAQLLGPDPQPLQQVAATDQTPPQTGRGAVDREPLRPSPTESLPLGAGGGEAKAAQSFLHPGLGKPVRPKGAEGASIESGSQGWWRTAGVLLLIIGLIVAFGFVLRRWAGKGGSLLGALGPGGRAPAGILQVLGRYPMGRGQTLILLKLDRRVLLLCQTVSARGSGVRTLCELTDPEEVSSVLMLTSEAEGRSLAAKFRGMVTSFETSHEAAESVLAPVVLPTPDAGRDPVDGLRSRLVRLRGGAA